MSANPQVFYRSNDSSSLYQSIKSRNSLVNAFDYGVGGEANICPYAKSKIVISPQTSMNATANQTMKWQLPDHLLLQKLYLKVSFTGGGDTNEGSSNEIALTEFVAAASVNSVRFIYQGSTIFEADLYSLLIPEYARATAERGVMLDYMMGGGILGAENGTLGSVTGRKAMASQANQIDVAVPLHSFFSEKLGTALDLAALASPVFVEVNFKDVASLHEESDSTTTYAGCELIAYGADLPSNERQAYNARNYSPGSVSSQLGYTNVRFSESATVVRNAPNTEGALGTEIKLNSISGLVRRLWVFATLDTDTSANNYFKFVDIDKVVLKAGNQTIYEIDHAHAGVDVVAAANSGNGYRVDNVIEMFNNGLPYSARHLINSDVDPSVQSAISPIGAGTTDLSKVKCINFGFSPDARSAADGILSFGGLANPVLEVKLSLAATSAAHTIHAVAEVVDIITYNSSQNGVINVKQITE